MILIRKSDEDEEIIQWLHERTEILCMEFHQHPIFLQWMIVCDDWQIV